MLLQAGRLNHLASLRHGGVWSKPQLGVAGLGPEALRSLAHELAGKAHAAERAYVVQREASWRQWCRVASQGGAKAA
eukprot:553145-Alexandrium_andersonii.AAC.1